MPLEIHPLTIEDIFETGTIPKVEDFGRYLYVRAHGVAVPPEGAYRLRKQELDIVLGPGWVFTHHGPETHVCSAVREELLRLGRALDASRVAHLLLDRLVDEALPAMDAIDDEVEKLEKESLPELHWRWGYPTVLAAMALTAGGFLWWFRRRGWLE